MPDKNSRILELGGREVLFLSDRLKSIDYDEDVTGKVPVGKRLLLKIGSVFNELCTDQISDVHVVICITEPEAWVLRERMTTKDQLQDDPLFGIRFLNKIYTVLLSFAADVEDIPIEEVTNDSYVIRSKKYLYDDDGSEEINA